MAMVEVDKAFTICFTFLSYLLIACLSSHEKVPLPRMELALEMARYETIRNVVYNH
jgi:hypothetical protein